MAIWAALKASRLFRMLAGAGALLVAVLAALGMARRQGRKDAVRDAENADRARSNAIEEQVDDVHAIHDRMSPDGRSEWLREHSARRD